MLRLPATQINLTQRDLTWHTNRHRARLAHCASLLHAKLSSAGLRADVEEGVATKSRPHYSLPGIERVINAHGSVISGEPIPRDSRAFWEGLVADVLSRPQVPIDSERLFDGRQSRDTETSLDAETSAWSLRTSGVRGTSDGTLSSSAQGFSEPEAQIDENDNLPRLSEQGEQEAYLQSRFSSDTLSSLEEDYGEESLDTQLPREESAPKSTQRRRHSFFGFHRRNNTCNSIAEEDGLESKYRSPGKGDLDGSSDIPPDHYKGLARLTQDDTNTDPTTDRNGNGSNRRFGALAIDDDDRQDSDETVRDLSSLFTEPDDHSVSPHPPRLPRSIELLRSRSGDFPRSILPRSPLYISQVPKSSSPDKHPASATRHPISAVADEPGFLSCPPRRRKRYIQSSENQSIVGSEASQNLIKALGEGADLARLEDIYQQIENSSVVSTLSYQDETYNSPLHPSSQPSLHSDHNGPLRKSSSIHERQGSLSHPLVPRRSLPTVSNPAISNLPPLPPPFSKTPRQLSPSYTFPSSPPVNPFTTSPNHPALPSSNTYITSGPSSSPDPLSLPPYTFLPTLPLRNPFSPAVDQHPPQVNQHRSSSALSNPLSTPPGSERRPRRYIPSLSPPPPMTPHRSMRVYNDSLPASAQPQTPIGLPRNGLPHMLTMTAPAGAMGGRNPRSRARISSGAWALDGGEDQTPRLLGSPRRAGRSTRLVVDSSEQENFGVEGERWWIERQREQMEARMGRGGEAGLDRTPPRAERRVGL